MQDPEGEVVAEVEGDGDTEGEQEAVVVKEMENDVVPDRVTGLSDAVRLTEREGVAVEDREGVQLGDALMLAEVDALRLPVKDALSVRLLDPLRDGLQELEPVEDHVAVELGGDQVWESDPVVLPDCVMVTVLRRVQDLLPVPVRLGEPVLVGELVCVHVAVSVCDALLVILLGVVDAEKVTSEAEPLLETDIDSE